jgi:hypothetical protein
MSQLQLRETFGEDIGIPRINIRVSPGHGSTDQADAEVCTDLVGNYSWPLFPGWPAEDYTLWINDRNVNPRYEASSRFVPNTSDGHFDDVAITLARAPLARLVRIEGHRMVTEDGMPVYGRMASEFLLYKKYLEGEASIRPVLEQLADLGGNVIRVMGMFESLGGFNPKNYGDRYYDAIPGFCALCAEYGIYVYWVACAATGSMFTGDEALRHTQRTAEQLVTTQNAIFSYVNEQGQHNNSVDRERFRREVNTGWMLYDTGSFGADLTCDPPYGTHACLHVRRVYPASIKDGCIVDNGNYVADHLQVWLDEPDRYGDDGNGSVEQAADAAGTAYTALGWCFHSMQGERGEVLTGNTLDCARAAFRAMAR